MVVLIEYVVVLIEYVVVLIEYVVVLIERYLSFYTCQCSALCYIINLFSGELSIIPSLGISFLRVT